jgi:hypothetical protein
MWGYGAKELTFAEPFANALVSDPSFRRWVLQQTIFSAFADARLLHREMQMQRNAKYWWRSHFTGRAGAKGAAVKRLISWPSSKRRPASVLHFM